MALDALLLPVVDMLLVDMLLLLLVLVGMLLVLDELPVVVEALDVLAEEEEEEEALGLLVAEVLGLLLLMAEVLDALLAELAVPLGVALPPPPMIMAMRASQSTPIGGCGTTAPGFRTPALARAMSKQARALVMPEFSSCSASVMSLRRSLESMRLGAARATTGRARMV